MRLSTFLAAVALATAAVIPATPSFAYDSASGGLNVRLVSSTDGMPVQGLPVTISAGGVVEDAVTDASGIAHFTTVHAGVVSVETQERVVGNCAETIAVKADRTTDVTLRVAIRTSYTPFDAVGAASTGSCSTT